MSNVYTYLSTRYKHINVTALPYHKHNRGGGALLLWWTLPPLPKFTKMSRFFNALNSNNLQVAAN